MNLGELFSSAIEGFLRNVIDNVIAPGVTEVMNWVTSSNNLSGFTFFDNFHQAMLVVGIAVLTMLTAFGLFRTYFSFLGATNEYDDPLHIGLKYAVGLFLVWYSRDLLMLAVDLNSSFIETIIVRSLGTEGYASLASYLVVGLMSVFTTGPLAISLLSWMIIPVAYVIYRLIQLLFRMFYRMVLIAFLVIISPLMFATGVLRATDGFRVGFLRVFSGCLVIQMIQTMCLMALGSVSFSGIIGLPTLMTIFGILFVADQAESIVRELSFGIGASSHRAEGVMAAITGTSHLINSTGSAVHTARSFVSSIPSTWSAVSSKVATLLGP
ncbi:MAG: hypothetical protein FWE76_01995 [Symbiobacteriaceae bacterium]|nr:hypothetical protein [Symbiobacteriaceae bacterium]